MQAASEALLQAVKTNHGPLKFRNEYFPFLLPFFYIMHYFFVNYPFFPLRDALSLLTRYVVAAVILVLVFFLLLKSWRKASVFAFALLLIEFFYIALFEFISKKLPGKAFNQFLIPAILLSGMLWFFFRLRKYPGELSKVVRFLNVLMAAWIVVELCVFLVFKNYLGSELRKIVPLKDCQNCNKPDVYLLIMDEYAGQKTLADKFNFDNAEFFGYLRQKNFHIVQNSKSNYNLTLFSMASMLSLDYIRVSSYSKPAMKDYMLAGVKLRHSTVAQFFEKNGYDVRNLSLFNILKSPPPFKHSYLRNFVAELNSRTLTGHFQLLLSKPGKIDNPDSSLDAKYNRAVVRLALNQPGTSNKPKFVYAHFLMPHYPHFYDQNGHPIDQARWYGKDTYESYLKYTNRQMMTVIDKILSSSNKPPIILLMSDHGYRGGISNAVDENYYFINVNAIYLPNQNYSAWYDGVSNVNQFRILFNQQFNQHLPLLKDTSYMLLGAEF